MPRPKYKMCEGAVAMMRAKYLKGESVTALATEFGITLRTAYRALGDLPAQRRAKFAAFLSGSQPVSSTAPRA